MMKSYPVKIEIYDHKEPIARVNGLDGAAAMVKVSTPVNANSWPAISRQILAALVSMELEGDEAPAAPKWPGLSDHDCDLFQNPALTTNDIIRLAHEDGFHMGVAAQQDIGHDEA